jgi:hypothetical protein
MVAAGHEMVAAGQEVGVTEDQLAALHHQGHPARLGHQHSRIARDADFVRPSL